MKRVLIFVCLMACQHCFGNSIDTINNIASVIGFVKKEMPEYSYIVDGSQINGGTFYKVDIDKNGLTDILLSNEYCLKYAILDSGGHYHVARFEDFKYKYKAVIEADSSTRLILEVKQQGEKLHDVERYELEVAYDKGFVEYNPTPSKHKIEKVSFDNRPGWTTFDRYTIVLKSDLSANLVQDSTNVKKRCTDSVFAYKMLLAERFDKICSLLNYIAFESLNDEYHSMVFDMPIATLSVYYDDGKVKTIQDMGMAGTLGLVRLYGLLDNVFEENGWQVRSVRSSKLRK